MRLVKGPILFFGMMLLIIGMGLVEFLIFNRLFGYSFPSDFILNSVLTFILIAVNYALLRWVLKARGHNPDRWVATESSQGEETLDKPTTSQNL